jgi:hypothetical protein
MIELMFHIPMKKCEFLLDLELCVWEEVIMNVGMLVVTKHAQVLNYPLKEELDAKILLMLSVLRS